MITECYGSFIYIAFSANEISGGPTQIQLPAGYSYERIFIHDLINITALLPYQSVKSGDRITFPAINCKSPSIYIYSSPILVNPLKLDYQSKNLDKYLIHNILANLLNQFQLRVMTVMNTM